jgi:hypothetical protein
MPDWGGGGGNSYFLNAENNLIIGFISEKSTYYVGKTACIDVM